MARPKKNLEPIVGTGKEPTDLTVQKSKPLFSLWRSDMTLAEFKILDSYLSRIDSHKPERRTVVFTKGELEQLLGVKKINKADLTSRLKGLGRFVELPTPDNAKKFHQVALFEEAYGDMDENGLWTVRLTCTDKAMRYIFNVEKLQYLRYKLRCITSLTSRYTYILFMYLEQNRFRKSWEVDVDELKQILNCDQDELYSEFKFFNQRILKRCQKELHEKSECRFTYEPLKSGRKVTKVRFTLETLSDHLEETYEPVDPEQLSMFTHEDELELLSEACKNEFNKEQMEAIYQIINVLGIHEMPVVDGFENDVRFARFHYLSQHYSRMQAYAADHPIKHRFSYFCSMLKRAQEY